MLLRMATLERVAAGEIRCAFRRWRRPTVRSGGQLRTALGVLAIESVERVDPEALTAADARAAGFDTLAALRAELARRSAGEVYRVCFGPLTADPRVALREDDALDDEAAAELGGRLARMDRAAKGGPWTRQLLELLAANPGVRSAELAPQMAREQAAFKRDVRKLKNLGLTISLETGYRLSPRGERLLAWLAQAAD